MINTEQILKYIRTQGKDATANEIDKIISEYDKDLESILSFDSELEKLCTNNKIKYIKMQDVLSEEDFIDGLHPNTNGHQKICDYIIKKLESGE